MLEKRTREVLDLLNESLGELIFESDENGKINRKNNSGLLKLILFRRFIFFFFCKLDEFF